MYPLFYKNKQICSICNNNHNVPRKNVYRKQPVYQKGKGKRVSILILKPLSHKQESANC